MTDLFFIFGAKYLFLFSALIILIVFYVLPLEFKKRMIVFGIASCALALVISFIAREIYFNPRPFVVDGFEPLIPHKADNGFPSDHTLLVATLASIGMFFHRRASLYLWLIAIVVAISRVYVGVHNPIDILASISIALASTLAVHAIIENTKLWKTTNKQTNF